MGLASRDGLGQPGYVQYLKWVAGILHGDFGRSFEWNQPVANLLWDRMTYFFTDEGTVKAVDGVDFSIARGEIVCVVGESGCGKSATARSILQIVDRPGRVVSGQILLHSDDGVLDLAGLNPHGKAIRQVRGKPSA